MSKAQGSDDKGKRRRTRAAADEDGTRAGDDAAAEADAEGAGAQEGGAEERPVSIDDLVAALGEDAGAQRPAEGEGAEVQLVDELPVEADDDLREVSGEASPRLVSIVESLLFAASRPLTVKRIRQVLKDPTTRQIQLALKRLIADRADGGIIVAQVAGGFALKTQPINAGFVQQLLQARPARLSRPQLETLAVIAYRQPVTHAEIDDVRGVDSGAVMRLLLEKDLVQIVGRKEEPGRPMLYGTTVRFLEFFNLMSLRDLPELGEFRELSDETRESLAAKLGEDEAEALGQEVMDFAREATRRASEEADAAAREVAAGEGDGEDLPSAVDADSDGGPPSDEDAADR